MTEPETIKPLFVVDIATLKARLRLTAATATDALAILDSVVEEVRIGFYNSLGSPRVSHITAIDYKVNGTTTNDLLRALANVAEVKWCRMILLRRLPILFQDGNVAQLPWNQEGIAREISSLNLKQELERMQIEVQIDLDALAGEIENPSSVTASCIGPDTTPARPGAILSGRNLYQ